VTVEHLRARAGRRALPDGSTVFLRPLRRDDATVLLTVFAGLGPRSRELRFLAPKRMLTSADLRRLTSVDGHDHVAVVAYSAAWDPIGVGRFVRDADATTAEVAVAVVDGWQGRGVGTVLSSELAAHAREVGIQRFTATMSGRNEGAARLMRRLSGKVEPGTAEGGVAEYVVHLSAGAEECRAC
jgi:RimJ/RimL family protein N-acetyltransferase